MKRVARLMGVSWLVSSLFLAPHVAQAGEVHVMLGGAGGSSSWARDPTGYSTFKLGYRFADLAAFYVLTRLGYAPVNDRTLTYLSLGAQLWGRMGTTRPYVRIAGSHQHEESVAAVKADAGGALLGVGDGIRHRAGGELALGLELPLRKDKGVQWIVSFEGSSIYFPDPRGPNVYLLGALALGANFSL